MPIEILSMELSHLNPTHGLPNALNTFCLAAERPLLSSLSPVPFDRALDSQKPIRFYKYHSNCCDRCTLVLDLALYSFPLFQYRERKRARWHQPRPFLETAFTQGGK